MARSRLVCVARSQFSPGQMPPQLTMAAAEAGSCGSKCKVSRGPARVLHAAMEPWDAMGCHGNHGVGHKNRDLMDLIMKCLGGSFEHMGDFILKFGI